MLFSGIRLVRAKDRLGRLDVSHIPARTAHQVRSGEPAQPPATIVASGIDLMVERIDEAVDAQTAAHRANARLWTSLAELMRLARANPQVYLRPAGLGQRDALELAQDTAAFDAGLRLRLSAAHVRDLAYRAQVLEDRMPQLNAAFAAGTTSPGHVSAAVDLVAGWTDDRAVRRFDEQLAEPATTMTTTAFRARARRLKEQLLPERPETRHARAFAGRRVWLERVDDGMAWIHALVAAPDAVRIVARLNATARAEQKKTSTLDSNWRTRDQIRADLFASWLAGDGTPTAAKVRPILLVPMLSLIGDGDEPIELRGYGTVDSATARRLFTEADSFRRVGTDPFSGEKLVYDHSRYRPTMAQRDWIAMRFEECIDPTCSRPVDDADADHLEEWIRDNGRTDADNLFPLCEVGNRRKNLSRLAYRRLGNGRVSISTPTGLTVTTEAPPF